MMKTAVGTMPEDVIGHIGLVAVGWKKDGLLHGLCDGCGWRVKMPNSVDIVAPILEHHRDAHADVPSPTRLVEHGADRPPDHR